MLVYNGFMDCVKKLRSYFLALKIVRKLELEPTRGIIIIIIINDIGGQNHSILDVTHKYNPQIPSNYVPLKHTIKRLPWIQMNEN
jgi:hypothetical protein